MKLLDIRARLLLAAIMPVTLVAIVLSAIFLMGRLDDLEQAHTLQAQSQLRQIADASEYGIFSGNVESLKALAAGGVRVPGVRAVTIFDLTGRVLVSAGASVYGNPPHVLPNGTSFKNEKAHIDVFSQSVVSKPITLDEALGEAPKTAAQTTLGRVVIEVSRSAVVSRTLNLMWAGLAVTLGGVLMGVWLAVRISRGVIRPILNVSEVIDRLGHGELSTRLTVKPNDPLQELQHNLNQMAERLERGRDELEQRVNEVTHELRERKEEAEQATLSKSQFLSAASHDLRQPTHALGMFVARLAQLPHSDETQALIVNLDASVQAMQDLLDALLDISRLEANAVRVNASPFPIADILTQLNTTLAPEAFAKGLGLRVRASPYWVLSDSSLLQRILLNLMSNALRYTSRGGVLVVCRPTRGGQALRIEVWDTGIGIATQHQQDIFKEFYQVGNVERDRSQGLGLGLNIVQRTAKLLDHPLGVCSRPGRGTRFSIEVPVTAALARSVASVPLEAPLEDHLTGLSVLVIEDDALVSLALVSLLESWGCVVTVVEGLTQAEPLMAQGFSPRVLISDYRLRAGQNGLDAILRLREISPRHLPACLLSGDTNPELMQSTRLAGLTLLHKPVRPAKLRNLIRHLAQEGGPDDRRAHTLVLDDVPERK
jgi:two-component system, sensor histidine kinase